MNRESMKWEIYVRLISDLGPRAMVAQAQKECLQAAEDAVELYYRVGKTAPAKEEPRT